MKMIACGSAESDVAGPVLSQGPVLDDGDVVATRSTDARPPEIEMLPVVPCMRRDSSWATRLLGGDEDEIRLRATS